MRESVNFLEAVKMLWDSLSLLTRTSALLLHARLIDVI